MLRARLVTSILALGLSPVLGACASGHHHPAMTMDQLRTPTPEHKLLLEGVGTWEGTLTTYMGGMDGQQVAAKEVVEGVGPFFTQSRFTCEFPGMPYLGMGCVGYDPATKMVVGTWFDNTGSYLAQMHGTIDVAKKTMSTHFEAPDEMTGEMAQNRIDTVFGADTYTSTFFRGEGSAATKTMVISMKRTSKGTK